MSLGTAFRRVPTQPACFVLVAAAYLVHFRLSGYDRFYYDAQEYWDLGRSFQSRGHFSLLIYDDDLRGYSLPLVYDGLREIADVLGLGGVTIVEVCARACFRIGFLLRPP